MNNECRIKRATVEDAEILAELGKRTYLQHFSSIWGVERLQGYLQENYAPDVIAAQLADPRHCSFLIASIAQRQVGLAKLNWNRPVPTTHSPAPELERLHIDAPFTGRGIGTLLLKSSLLLVQEQQQNELWLQVPTGNDAARRFYRRHGFASIGKIPFSTDVTQTELVVMIFNLAAAARTK